MIGPSSSSSSPAPQRQQPSRFLSSSSTPFLSHNLSLDLSAITSTTTKTAQAASLRISDISQTVPPIRTPQEDTKGKTKLPTTTNLSPRLRQTNTIAASAVSLQSALTQDKEALTKQLEAHTHAIKQLEHAVVADAQHLAQQHKENPNTVSAERIAQKKTVIQQGLQQATPPLAQALLHLWETTLDQETPDPLPPFADTTVLSDQIETINQQQDLIQTQWKRLLQKVKSLKKEMNWQKTQLQTYLKEHQSETIQNQTETQIKNLEQALQQPQLPTELPLCSTQDAITYLSALDSLIELRIVPQLIEQAERITQSLAQTAWNRVDTPKVPVPGTTPSQSLAPKPQTETDMRSFFAENKPQFNTYYGYRVFTSETVQAPDSFLFVEPPLAQEIETVKSIKLLELKKNIPLTDGVLKARAMEAYCYQHSLIVQYELVNYAKQIFPNWSTASEVWRTEKLQLLKDNLTLVIDFERMQTRIYFNWDPRNTPKELKRTQSFRYQWGKDKTALKEMKRIMGVSDPRSSVNLDVEPHHTESPRPSLSSPPELLATSEPSAPLELSSISHSQVSRPARRPTEPSAPLELPDTRHSQVSTPSEPPTDLLSTISSNTDSASASHKLTDTSHTDEPRFPEPTSTPITEPIPQPHIHLAFPSSPPSSTPKRRSQLESKTEPLLPHTNDTLPPPQDVPTTAPAITSTPASSLESIDKTTSSIPRHQLPVSSDSSLEMPNIRRKAVPKNKTEPSAPLELPGTSHSQVSTPSELPTDLLSTISSNTDSASASHKLTDTSHTDEPRFTEPTPTPITEPIPQPDIHLAFPSSPPSSTPKRRSPLEPKTEPSLPHTNDTLPPPQDVPTTAPTNQANASTPLLTSLSSPTQSQPPFPHLASSYQPPANQPPPLTRPTGPKKEARTPPTTSIDENPSPERPRPLARPAQGQKIQAIPPLMPPPIPHAPRQPEETHGDIAYPPEEAKPGTVHEIKLPEEIMERLHTLVNEPEIRKLYFEFTRAETYLKDTVVDWLISLDPDLELDKTHEPPTTKPRDQAKKELLEQLSHISYSTTSELLKAPENAELLSPKKEPHTLTTPTNKASSDLGFSKISYTNKLITNALKKIPEKTSLHQTYEAFSQEILQFFLLCEFIKQWGIPDLTAEEQAEVQQAEKKEKEQEQAMHRLRTDPLSTIEPMTARRPPPTSRLTSQQPTSNRSTQVHTRNPKEIKQPTKSSTLAENLGKLKHYLFSELTEAEWQDPSRITSERKQNLMLFDPEMQKRIANLRNNTDAKIQRELQNILTQQRRHVLALSHQIAKTTTALTNPKELPLEMEESAQKPFTQTKLTLSENAISYLGSDLTSIAYNLDMQSYSERPPMLSKTNVEAFKTTLVTTRTDILGFLVTSEVNKQPLSPEIAGLLTKYEQKYTALSKAVDSVLASLRKSQRDVDLQPIEQRMNELSTIQQALIKKLPKPHDRPLPETVIPEQDRTSETSQRIVHTLSPRHARMIRTKLAEWRNVEEQYEYTHGTDAQPNWLPSWEATWDALQEDIHTINAIPYFGLDQVSGSRFTISDYLQHQQSAEEPPETEAWFTSVIRHLDEGIQLYQTEPQPPNPLE